MELLTNYQRTIVEECLAKGSGGLSLPMGSGKTLIALVLSLTYFEETHKPTLIIASKTLLSSWGVEIKKFFNDTLLFGKHFVILHHDYMSKQAISAFMLTEDLKIVITTPEFCSRYYTEYNVESVFIHRRPSHNVFGEDVEELEFKVPNRPYLRSNSMFGPHHIHSTAWAGLIVDEGQKYTNIMTVRARAMASVYAKHRWILSGTMFYEPKLNLIMGYHLIIGDKTFPNTLKEASILLLSEFEGLNKTMVIREKNEMIPEDGPVMIEHMVSFQNSDEEDLIYISMKKIMMELKKKVIELRSTHSANEIRKFSSYILACITYLRQIIVCPMVPLASAMLDIYSTDKKSELSEIIVEKIKELNLFEWSNDEENACSTRMRETMKILDNHKDEKVVMFTSFRSCLDVFKYFLGRDMPQRHVYTITSSMSIKKRGEEVANFLDSQNGIFFITYDIGAEGLNLQRCNNVVILDTWWNCGKITQAVARCFRYGQTKDVNVYFLTSNTGLENAFYKKSSAKLDVLKELETGKVESTLPKFKIDEIIKMFAMEDNNKCVKELNRKAWRHNQQEVEELDEIEL